MEDIQRLKRRLLKFQDKKINEDLGTVKELSLLSKKQSHQSLSYKSSQINTIKQAHSQKIINISSELFSQKYSIFQWIVYLVSTWFAYKTVCLTRQFAVLEMLFGLNLNNKSAIIDGLKWYGTMCLAIKLLVYLMRQFNSSSQRLKIFICQLQKTLSQSIQTCIFIIFMNINYYLSIKTTKQKKYDTKLALNSICHIFTWFVIGQICLFIGFLFGSLVRCRSLKAYGLTIGRISMFMAFFLCINTFLNINFDPMSLLIV